MIIDGEERKTYKEIIAHEKKQEWLRAMRDEMKSLHENHTYDLVKPPHGKKALKKKRFSNWRQKKITHNQVIKKIGSEII